MTTDRRRPRDLVVVAVVTVVATVLFSGRAFYMDEPYYLHKLQAEIQGIVQAPGAIWGIDNNPPVFISLLRPAVQAVGARERPLRLLFLPLDLLAAIALYLLAARFLKRPLWPTLIILAGPAYLIDMERLMPEKPAFAFALFGLYCAVRGIDDSDERWYWASCVPLAAALLSKYIAVFSVVAVAVYALSRGRPARKVVAHSVLSGLPLLGWFMARPAVLDGASIVLREANKHLWLTPTHRLRSVLAFVGGCWLLALVRPAGYGAGWKRLAGCLAAAVLLFLPALDCAQVLPVDRVTGVAFATVALLGLLSVFGPSRTRGRALWAAWTAMALGLAAAYWTIMARTVMFCIPALVLAWAEHLEQDLGAESLVKIERLAFVLTAAIALTAAAVDYRYADCEKQMAEKISADYLARGRTVWCAGTPELRYYLEARGARPLDRQSDWDLVKPHDIVLLAKTSTQAPPPRRFLAKVQQVLVQSSLPLRLYSTELGEAGFYWNVSGFLPYAVSDEPVDGFTIVEKQ